MNQRPFCTNPSGQLAGAPRAVRRGVPGSGPPTDPGSKGHDAASADADAQSADEGEPGDGGETYPKEAGDAD